MGDFCLLHVASLNLWNKDSFESSLIGLDGQADGVWPLLVRNEDADVTAVGIILRNVVLAMQETIIGCAFAIGMNQHGVLSQADGVRLFLVVNTSRLNEHPKVQVFTTFSHPGTLYIDRVLA